MYHHHHHHHHHIILQDNYISQCQASSLRFTIIILQLRYQYKVLRHNFHIYTLLNILNFWNLKCYTEIDGI
jgi:hypothetical protein